jgi:hypothetical protein
MIPPNFHSSCSNPQMTSGLSTVTHHAPVTALTARSVRFIVYPCVTFRVPKFARDFSKNIFAFHQLLLSSTPSWRRKTYSLSIVIDKELDVRLMSFHRVTHISAATMGLEQSRQIVGMKSVPIMPL